MLISSFPELETAALDYIRRIDDLGGAPRAIDAGYVQDEIMDASYEHQKLVESKERIVVGMNEYIVEEPPPSGLLKVDLSVGERQKEKPAALKTNRDQDLVNSKLLAIRNACEGSDNVMPVILDAVKAYATLGEICGVMRDVFGEYKQNVSL